jgi:hypothetical protein
MPNNNPLKVQKMTAIQLMEKFAQRATNPSIPKWERMAAVTYACRAQTVHYKLTGELVELNLTYTDAEKAA